MTARRYLGPASVIATVVMVWSAFAYDRVLDRRWNELIADRCARDIPIPTSAHVWQWALLGSAVAAAILGAGFLIVGARRWWVFVIGTPVVLLGLFFAIVTAASLVHPDQKATVDFSPCGAGGL